MKWTFCARIWAALLLVGVCWLPTTGAWVFTVDDDGPADFNNIQAAIDKAVDWDIVEIQPGRYSGAGNYNIRYNGKAITVRGTNPEDFDVVAATVVDCNNRGRGFTFYRGETSDSVLSGLTIINGRGAGDWGNAGAVACLGGSPTITNCIMTGNSGSGGAIGVNDNSDLIVRNCIITHNASGRYGGGIFCTDSNSATIENCIISHNTCGTWGGGVRIRCDEPSIIKNCIITGNISEVGSGISARKSDLMVIGCVITGNIATERGGGISVRQQCHLAVSRSIVCDNYSPEGSEIALFNGWSGSGYLLSASYSNIAGGLADVWNDGTFTIDWGLGNIDADPCFADPGWWGHIAEPIVRVEPNDPNALWVDGGGDYHLKSQGGRWYADEGGWTMDDVTSLCIDAGDPSCPLGLEPFPNGGRINMGAYGGTLEASKSYFGKALCATIVAGDINGDCSVDGRDFAFLGFNWLVSNPQAPNPLLPERAFNPEPANGAVDLPIPVGRDVPIFSLKWQAGVRAETHDVYFGTVSPGEFQGNQTEIEFVPDFGFTSGPYYWRIDEVSSHGKTTGTVWTFSFLPPEPAFDPNPVDGATDVRNDLLTWTPREGVTSHNVYFGTESPGTFMGNVTGPGYYDVPYSLTENVQYYWRVDGIGVGGVTEGPVWIFTAGPQSGIR